MDENLSQIQDINEKMNNIQKREEINKDCYPRVSWSINSGSDPGC